MLFQNPEQIVIKDRDGYFRSDFLLGKENDAYAVMKTDIALTDLGIIGIPLASITAYKKHITHFHLLTSQSHVIQCPQLGFGKIDFNDLTVCLDLQFRKAFKYCRVETEAFLPVGLRDFPGPIFPIA